MGRRRGRYFATAELMDDAFLGLLQEKDIDLITVKEICSRAGVSRSTFYLHYDTVADLFEESMDLVLRRFLSVFDDGAGGLPLPSVSTAPVEELRLVTPEVLVPYLGFIRDNRGLFATLVRNAGSMRLDEVYARMERHLISPILDRFQVPPADRPYLMAFYLNGLMAIVGEWTAGGCREPAERIAGIMCRCCEGAGAPAPAPSGRPRPGSDSPRSRKRGGGSVSAGTPSI